jgi:hypothetical protein
MTIQTVNLGSYANDGTGDDLRTAFTKVNSNTEELDLTRVVSAVNLGLGAEIFKDKVAKNLQLRKINAGINITVTQNANDISIATPDSINNLVEDTSPQLGGNLDLNNFTVLGTGNVEIDGVVKATNLTASSLTATRVTFAGTAGLLSGSAGLTFAAGVLTSTTGFAGPLTGALTGNVTGNLTGNVTGNVTGTVSSIGNHNLEDLADVSSAIPTVGQALTWNGSAWTPNTITSGVSRIIAGSNVTISPINGLGNVTINSTGGGGGSGDLDFGSFTNPSGFTLDLGSF